jgi:anti-sigma factor RsiW
MAETPQTHLRSEDLVGLALGEQLPERTHALRHLSECLLCRREYDELAAAVEQTLPAAPRVEPPAGFDRRVLGAMDLSTGRRQRRLRRALRPGLVAAAVGGVILGAGGMWAAAVHPDRTPSASPPYARVHNGATTALHNPSGKTVGSVVRTSMEGRDVAVVELSDDVTRIHLRCRLLRQDGRIDPAGDWTVRPGADTWVVPVNPGQIRLNLVSDNGHLFASARI